MGVYDVNENLAVASLSSLAHLAHLLGIASTMSHFQSLGSQMESRGFLTTSLDPESSSAYYTLTLAPTKRPIAYCIAKRPWRRTRVTFYPDSSPKANRQARETSAETRNDTGRRLCEMAVLSAKYVPTTAPVKKPGDICPPVVIKWVPARFYRLSTTDTCFIIFIGITRGTNSVSYGFVDTLIYLSKAGPLIVLRGIGRIRPHIAYAFAE